MFRWGIVGTGFVARKFVLGLRQSDGGRAVAAMSRDPANVRRFASDFGITTACETIEEALKLPDVDAFYIATPPSVHRQQAIACLSAGKPVLIEKPLATSLADAEAIIAAARSAGTFCMEGLWMSFLPLMAELRQVIGRGEIGDIRSFSGSFGIASRPEFEPGLFDRDAGGGALLHRCIYPIALALDLMGEAELVSSHAKLAPNGVDEDCVLVLRHGAGALSTVRASLRVQLANDFTIEGTGGTIHVEAPIYRPFRMRVSRTGGGNRRQRGAARFEAFREGTLAQQAQQRLGGLVGVLRGRNARTMTRLFAGNGYHYEADEVMRCVRSGMMESAIMPLSRSLAISQIMTAAQASWSATGN